MVSSSVSITRYNLHPMLTTVLSYLQDHMYLDISQVLIETSGYAIGIELKLKLFDIYSDVHSNGLAHILEWDHLKSFAKFNVFVGQIDDILQSAAGPAGPASGDTGGDGNPLVPSSSNESNPDLYNNDSGSSSQTETPSGHTTRDDSGGGLGRKRPTVAPLPSGNTWGRSAR